MSGRVNASFCAGPDERTVRRWVEVTPEGFTFDVKLHRLLSRHAAPPDSLPARLRERARTTERGRVVLTPALEQAVLDVTLEALRPLTEAGRLSSLLLQLSPAFAPRSHRLDTDRGSDAPRAAERMCARLGRAAAA